MSESLTDTAALRTWLAEHAEVELPHRYEFWGRYTPQGDAPRQRLLHVDDHTLRFSWNVEDMDTTVETGLEEEPDSTIITLVHTGPRPSRRCLPGPARAACCTRSGRWPSRTSSTISRAVSSPRRPTSVWLAVEMEGVRTGC